MWKRGKKWSYEDDKFLIENYKIYGLKHCSETLKRSIPSVRQRCSDLNLYCRKQPWSKQEIDILKEFYQDKGAGFCCHKLNRSLSCVISKAYCLDLSMKRREKHQIISKIDSKNVFAICPKHGTCRHYIDAKYNTPQCILCKNLGARKRSKTEEGKIKRRIKAHKRYLTPLGRYETRLRTRLRTFSNHKLSFSKDLPYSSQDLCSHLESIRINQDNCCPMCRVSYGIKPFDIDHIVPTHTAKTREGLLKLFYLNNLSLLCFDCNRNVKRGRLDIKYNYGFNNVY